MYKLIIKAWNLRTVKIYNPKTDQHEVHKPLTFPKANDVTYNISDREGVEYLIKMATKSTAYKYEIDIYQSGKLKPETKKINWT